MIAIAKMTPDSFRKDMFKAKRKPLDEIWSGDTFGVAEIIRFSPSACNLQPWIVESNDNTLTVFRYKQPGKRGIMPADKVSFYNRIDIEVMIEAVRNTWQLLFSPIFRHMIFHKILHNFCKKALTNISDADILILRYIVGRYIEKRYIDNRYKRLDSSNKSNDRF